ncbi:uncharacterized protein LJ264_000168 [Porphyrio hochstetteri]
MRSAAAPPSSPPAARKGLFRAVASAPRPGLQERGRPARPGVTKAVGLLYLPVGPACVYLLVICFPALSRYALCTPPLEAGKRPSLLGPVKEKQPSEVGQHSTETCQTKCFQRPWRTVLCLEKKTGGMLAQSLPGLTLQKVYHRAFGAACQKLCRE